MSSYGEQSELLDTRCCVFCVVLVFRCSCLPNIAKDVPSFQKSSLISLTTCYHTSHKKRVIYYEHHQTLQTVYKCYSLHEKTAADNNALSRFRVINFRHLSAAQRKHTSCLIFIFFIYARYTGVLWRLLQKKSMHLFKRICGQTDKTTGDPSAFHQKSLHKKSDIRSEPVSLFLWASFLSSGCSQSEG